MPKWMEALSYDNPLIKEIVDEVKNCAGEIAKIGEFKMVKSLFEQSDNFEQYFDDYLIKAIQFKKHLEE